MANYLYFRQTSGQFDNFKTAYGSAITAIVERQFAAERTKGNSCEYAIGIQYMLGYFLCIRVAKLVALGDTLADAKITMNWEDYVEPFQAVGFNIDDMYNVLYP